jgi:hypothetical protein
MIHAQKPGKNHVNFTLLAAFVGLLLFLTWLYRPSIHFGLIWDDPEWYGRVVGKSIFALLKPSTDYQFYRPGVMLFNRLFVQADGTLAIQTLHWAQIGWYVINLSLVFAISRRVGFGRWAAFMVVMLTAVHPFVYQSVAWAAPGQPAAAVCRPAELRVPADNARGLPGRYRAAADCVPPGRL